VIFNAFVSDALVSNALVSDALVFDAFVFWILLPPILGEDLFGALWG
jgi:hypothetical protein